MPRLLRAAGTLSLLAVPFLATPVLAGTAHADTPGPASPSASTSAAALAGTSFRTAGTLTPGQTGQATGAVGDYFYWSFQAQAGQSPNVTATVQLPPGTQRQGTETWRLDLYDGLRRAQPCVSGTPQAQAGTDSGSVQLSCTLPTIRSWAETWSDDPLPGTYYVRLTVGALPEQELGLQVSAQIGLAAPSGSDPSSDGSLSAPLSLPSAGPSAGAGATSGATSTDGASAQSASASAAPAAVGASSGFFSGGNARWWWTGGGAIAASLFGVVGFTLTRHPRRWFS
ncbi:peptidase [Streptacidiphilus neutrinimicus]|uniref:peptidase n=1 Tax=Streptacidiphilus neutrinimicus TaxID=105420 RepID=UPI001F39978D|nr:peptidase [Streptacidiphilus neutrinimicus]